MEQLRVVDPGSALFQQVAQQVNQFRTLHVEICRGTDRYRPPKAGIDISPLKYRLTVILNRESGEVEILGNPEEWKTLSKRQQIRRAKPARVCVTIFGDDGAENISSWGRTWLRVTGSLGMWIKVLQEFLPTVWLNQMWTKWKQWRDMTKSWRNLKNSL